MCVRIDADACITVPVRIANVCGIHFHTGTKLFPCAFNRSANNREDIKLFQSPNLLFLLCSSINCHICRSTADEQRQVFPRSSTSSHLHEQQQISSASASVYGQLNQLSCCTLAHSLNFLVDHIISCLLFSAVRKTTRKEQRSLINECFSKKTFLLYFQIGIY